MKVCRLAFFCLLILVNFMCQGNKALQNDALKNFFKNEFALQDLNKFHIGHCQIDSGVLIAQVYDSETRQHSQLYLANILTGEVYGFFNWPAPNNSFYFSYSYSNGKLFYLNDDNSIKRVNLKTKIYDTIPIGSNFKFIRDFVIAGDNLYSINNIYGISIINLAQTSQRIQLKPYKGSYFFGQNSISLPVDKAMNLICSSNINDSQFVVHAIDSGLNILWERSIILKDKNLEIKSLNVGDNYLLKYNNKIELISKIDGRLIWSKSFYKKIHNIFLQPANKVLVILSDQSSENLSFSPSNTGIYNILKLDISTQKIEWQQKIAYSNESFFAGEKEAFSFSSTTKNVKINMITGDLADFIYTGQTRVINDKKTGNNFLFSNNSIYW